MLKAKIVFAATGLELYIAVFELNPLLVGAIAMGGQSWDIGSTRFGFGYHVLTNVVYISHKQKIEK